MIESAMFFALGALVAGLLALLVVPALNARAERLARRRVEALFPMSIDELTAEKDHLRAEFAVLQRRLERRAETSAAGKQAEMEELGRRALRIEALAVDLAAREATLATTTEERDAARTSLAATEGELAETRATLEAARAALAALETRQAETAMALAATQGERDATATRLAEAEAAGESARTDLAARAAEIATLAAERDRALRDGDARRITISDLETRLGTQTARAEEGERRLARLGPELDEERARHAALAATLAAAEARALAAERQASVSVDEARILADNDDLRRRIAELADRLVAPAGPSAAA